MKIRILFLSVSLALPGTPGLAQGLQYTSELNRELKARSDSIKEAFNNYITSPDLESNNFFTLSPEARAKRVAEARQKTEAYFKARQKYNEVLEKSLKNTLDWLSRGASDSLRKAAPEAEESFRQQTKQLENQLNDVDDQMSRLASQNDTNAERKRRNLKSLEDIKDSLSKMKIAAEDNARRAKRMQDDAAAAEGMVKLLEESTKKMLGHVQGDQQLADKSLALRREYFDRLATIQPVVQPLKTSDPTFCWPGGGRIEGVFNYEADKRSKGEPRGVNLVLKISGDDTRSGILRLSFSSQPPIQIDLDGWQTNRAVNTESMRGTSGGRTFSITLLAAPDKDTANTVQFKMQETTERQSGESIELGLTLHRARR